MFIVLAQEGQHIRVGDRLIKALSVVRPGVVSVEVDGEPEPILLSWDRMLTIFPGVKVRVDHAICYSRRIKFFFDAPRSVTIRELPYDAGGQADDLEGRDTTGEAMRPHGRRRGSHTGDRLRRDPD